MTGLARLKYGSIWILIRIYTFMEVHKKLQRKQEYHMQHKRTNQIIQQINALERHIVTIDEGKRLNLMKQRNAKMRILGN